MAPHSEEAVHTNGNAVPHEPGLNTKAARGKAIHFPKPPTFKDPYEEREYIKGRLAAAFRIFGKYGYDEGVAGHITVRDPVEKDSFWVNPFGVSFSLIKKSDLIRVNEAGEIIDGGPVRLLNTAAYMIHSAIHIARPDVNAAAHSHSIYGRSFCALGKKLDTITQDSCAFHDVCAPSSFCIQPLMIAGPRTVRVIQRYRARGRRRPEHRSLPRKQEGRITPKSWAAHLWRDGRSCSLLVRQHGEVLPRPTISRRSCRWHRRTNPEDCRRRRSIYSWAGRIAACWLVQREATIRSYT